MTWFPPVKSKTMISTNFSVIILSLLANIQILIYGNYKIYLYLNSLKKPEQMFCFSIILSLDRYDNSTLCCCWVKPTTVVTNTTDYHYSWETWMLVVNWTAVTATCPISTIIQHAIAPTWLRFCTESCCCCTCPPIITITSNHLPMEPMSSHTPCTFTNWIRWCRWTISWTVVATGTAAASLNSRLSCCLSLCSRWCCSWCLSCYWTCAWVVLAEAFTAACCSFCFAR